MGKHKSRETFEWEVYLPDNWEEDGPVHCLPKDGSAHFVDAECPCEPRLVESSSLSMYKHRAEIEYEPIPNYLPEKI